MLPTTIHRTPSKPHLRFQCKPNYSNRLKSAPVTNIACRKRTWNFHTPKQGDTTGHDWQCQIWPGGMTRTSDFTALCGQLGRPKCEGMAQYALRLAAGAKLGNIWYKGSVIIVANRQIEKQSMPCNSLLRMRLLQMYDP